MKPIINLSKDKEYRNWVKELKRRYLSARLKASVDANRTLLEYYWDLGHDIADKQYANTYGSGFYKNLSHDLRMEMPGEKGFSERNLRNMYDFYHTYNQYFEILQQAAANSVVSNHQQRVDDFMLEIFSIPWDHQCKIVAKCKNNPEKALEAYNLPLGISQYELSKLIPSEIKSSLPSIEEIESSLEQLSGKEKE